MFKKIKSSIDNVFKPTAEHWSSLGSDLKARIDNFSQGRDVPQEALEENFQLVLVSWRMREEDIPHVITSLKMRVAVLLLPVLIAGALYIQGHHITAILMTVVSLFGVSVTLWRISILKNRRFRPFHRALVGFISKKLSKG